MKEERKQALISEFGFAEGMKIIEEELAIEEHCRINGITEHSISADGGCNMGCC